MKFNFLNFSKKSKSALDANSSSTPPINSKYKSYPNRTKNNALDVREALKQAEDIYYPYRDKLINIYNDTVNNAQVAACIERRKDLTLLRDYQFVNSKGDINDDIYKMLNKEWFNRIIDYSLDAIFFGYSLISLGDIVNDEFTCIDIIRRDYVSPDKNLILNYPASPSGVDFTDRTYNNWNILVKTPNMIGTSNTGFGILYPIALLEIYLRNLMGYNADFVQLSVQPFVVGKTDKTTEDERAEMFEMVSQFGSSAAALLDNNDSIEFLQPSNGSQWESYKDFEERLEKKISKMILGHSDAIDSKPGELGSSQGDNTPVAAALNDKRNKDSVFVYDIINKEVLPRLRSLGFSIPEDVIFEFKSDSEDNKNSVFWAELAGKMNQGGLIIDSKYFTEKTGIEISDQAPIEQKKL